jgi:hypothetical protein
MKLGKELVEIDLNALFKAIITDSNQIALESGLSIIEEHLSKHNESKYLKHDIDVRFNDIIIPPLIEKCLSSTRSGTRSKSTEIICLVTEISGSEYPVVRIYSNE